MILLGALAIVGIRVFYLLAEMWFERDWPRSTWRGLAVAIGLLILSVQAFGQAFRVDPTQWTINSNPQPNALYPMLSLPGSGVAMCQAPANAVPCTNFATTFTSSTGLTTCTAPAQLTRPGSNVCVAGMDAQGGFGAWLGAGNYQYTITTSYGSFGPYDLSVGAAGGGCTNNCSFGGLTNLATSVASGSSTSLGVYDSSRGLTQFASSLATGYLGATDACSKLIQLSINDDAGGTPYTGEALADNESIPQAIINCPLAFLWNPVRSTPVPNVPQNTTSVTTLAAGVTYRFPGSVTIPYGTLLKAQSPFNSNSNAGTFVEPNSSFVWQPFGSTSGSPLLSLGCPPGTSGGCLTAGSSVEGLGINCLSAPSMIGVYNGYGQQGSNIRDNYITQCLSPIVIAGAGTAGGSQNHKPVSGNIISMTAPPAVPGMILGIITAGGTGYPSNTTVAVGGCSVAPSFGVTVAAGVVTGVYPVGLSPFGTCPASGSGVTLSFTGSGGSGATATAVIGMVDFPAGIDLQSTAGGGAVRDNSIVAGKFTLIPPYGIRVNSGAQHLDGNYAESVNVADAVCPTGSQCGAVSVTNQTSSAANAPQQAALTITNPTSGYFGAIQGSGSWILQDTNLGISYPRTALSGFGGNDGALSFYARSIGRRYLQVGDEAGTNLTVNDTAPNCGSGACSGGTFPRPYMPVKLMGGDYWAMAPGDTVPAVGIWMTGFSSNSNQHATNAAILGLAPCIFDNAVTVGDYVQISPSATTPAECNDLGYGPSNHTPSSGQTLGTVADDGTSGSVTAPATPVVSGVTASVTNASTVTDTYCTTAQTALDQSRSACSATISVTNAPQQLNGAGSITFSGLQADQQYMYRATMGHSTIGSITIASVCGPDGTAIGVTGLPAGTGFTFAPTIVFAGGGFSTQPTGTLRAIGGQIVGIDWTTRGTGCTGNGTSTLTANSCDTGFISPTNSSTTFKDDGYCADGTTAPSAPQVAPRVHVNPQPWYGSLLLNPMTTAGDMVYGSSGGTPARLPVGANGQNMTLTGGVPTWGPPLGFMNGFVQQCGPGGTGTTIICTGAAVTAVGAGGSTVPATSSAPLLINNTSAASGCSTGAPCGAGNYNTSQANFFSTRQPLLTFGIAYTNASDYTANARIQMGLLSNVSACTETTMQASDSPSCTYVMIEYSTVRGDTTYQCVSDTSTGTPAITNIAVAPTTTFTKMLVGTNGSGQAFCTVGATTVTNATTFTNAPMGAFLLNGSTTNTATHLETNGWFGQSQNGSY